MSNLPNNIEPLFEEEYYEQPFEGYIESPFEGYIEPPFEEEKIVISNGPTPIHGFKKGDKVFHVELGTDDVVHAIVNGNFLQFEEGGSALNESYYRPYNKPEQKIHARAEHEAYKKREAAEAAKEVISLPPLIEKLKNAYKSYLALLGTKQYFNDKESDGIPAEILVKNLIQHLQSIQTMTGGAITYEKTDDVPLKTQLFAGNPLPADKIPEANNVLIIGAGPNGLYLAILLKAGNPDLNVNILENRVDSEGRRSLTREQYLELKSLCHHDLYTEVNKLSSRIAELLKVVESDRFCPKRPGLDPFYLIPVRPRGTAGIETNLLEYILANRAQGLGVNIFHDKELGNFYTKYTNSGTLAVFDATGGRLYKDTTGFKTLRTEDPTKIENKSKIQELINRKSFAVYRGYLPPDHAFRMINGIPYVAVGDTTLKTDYINGRGIEFNWFLILRYALTFTYFYQRELASAAAGGGGGGGSGFTGGRRRRTRKTFLPLKHLALLKKTARTRRRRSKRRLNRIHLVRR